MCTSKCIYKRKDAVSKSATHHTCRDFANPSVSLFHVSTVRRALRSVLQYFAHEEAVPRQPLNRCDEKRATVITQQRRKRYELVKLKVVESLDCEIMRISYINRSARGNIKSLLHEIQIARTQIPPSMSIVEVSRKQYTELYEKNPQYMHSPSSSGRVNARRNQKKFASKKSQKILEHVQSATTFQLIESTEIEAGQRALHQKNIRGSCRLIKEPQ